MACGATLPLMIRLWDMISFRPRGAIFDVDDTLLDNKPGVHGLHERSRLAAVHMVGQRHGIASLEALTPQQNLAAFQTASVHTLEAAVWNILLVAGLADGATLYPEHPLLREIVALKDELHEDILLRYGNEVPGASAFVRALAAILPADRLAIASTAVRRDVRLFLHKVGLTPLFPDANIKTKESTIRYKPHPEVFDAAFRSLGLNPADRPYVCAFEDDPRGIMAAKAAGLYVCAIATSYPASELAALAVAPDFVAADYTAMRRHFGLAA